MMLLLLRQAGNSVPGHNGGNPLSLRQLIPAALDRLL